MCVSEIKMITEINTLKVNKNAISVIENILERAKAGEVQSIIALGVDGEGNCWNQFGIDSKALILLGELRLVERDLIDLFLDTRVAPGFESI